MKTDSIPVGSGISQLGPMASHQLNPALFHGANV